MSIAEEIIAVAQLADIKPSLVRPAIAPLWLSGWSNAAGEITPRASFAVTDDSLFVVTEADADAFPVDISRGVGTAGRLILGERQRGSYAESVTLRITRTASGNTGLALTPDQDVRLFLGKTFLTFGGRNVVAATISHDSAGSYEYLPANTTIYLHLTLRGFLVPKEAGQRLRPFLVKVL